MDETHEGSITANGLEFAYLEAGTGPLALCLHGFPDTAWTFRHLLPELAGAGFRAVAPYMRGYAPTALPADGHYQSGALVRDALELHRALDGGGDAVLVGHDWGAIAAYGAAALGAECWRRVVTMAVPPLAAMGQVLFSYDQIRRSFYIWFFQQPLAEAVVAMNELDFVARLWADWSPGYDATDDLAHVRSALGAPANLEAAIGYYRASFNPLNQVPELAAEQSATMAPTPQPALYLHGDQDGCVGVDSVALATSFLGPGSEAAVIEGAGHFLHLEQPAEVNRRVLEFLARP